MRTLPTIELKRESMTRFAAILVTVLLGSASGCRLCCDSEDIAYPAYGGVWERIERNQGRVGSLYDPAGARASNLTDRNAPAENDDARSNIIPPQRLEEDLQDDSPIDPVPEPRPRSEGETEEEFEERLKKFQEEQMKDGDDDMLNAMIIPGSPQPPSFR